MDINRANLTPNQYDLIRELNIMCSENGFWMFMAMQSAIFQAGNSSVILNQIENFSQKWKNLFNRYYNQNYVNILEADISNFFDIYLSYLNDAIRGKNGDCESLLNQWKQVANVLGKSFSSVNPYWKEPEWRSILSNQIDVLNKEIKNNVQGIYSTLEQSYGIYHRVQIDMAEYFAVGLIRQFSL